MAPIVKYIPKNKTVWCPFDTEHSEFVLAMRDAGIRVVHSHILTGEDFFAYEPEKWDIIVGNPPFNIKQKVVERCLALGKPFALLLSNLWITAAHRHGSLRKRRCRYSCSTNVSSSPRRTPPISVRAISATRCCPVRSCSRILERSRFDRSRTSGDMERMTGLLLRHRT